MERDVLIKGSLSTLIIKIATFPLEVCLLHQNTAWRDSAKLGKSAFLCKLRGDILKGKNGNRDPARDLNCSCIFKE